MNDMANLSIRLPDDLDRRLADEADREHRPRSDVARQAIQWYLDAAERRRYTSAIVADARRLSHDETAAVAEEFLRVDNEALTIGEPVAAYRTSRKPSQTRQARKKGK